MKKFFHDNGIWIALAAILLAALLFVASIFMGGVANPFANVWGVITAPVQKVATSVEGWMDGIYSYAFAYDTLLEENEALRKQVAELEESAREGDSFASENERLRELLNLREKRADFVFESAQVIGRSTTNWNATLTISKGSLHGVEANDCVVDAMGNLVGIVQEVGLNWSTLITVVDIDLEIGGLLTDTGHAAILEGDFTLMATNQLKLSYIPQEATLQLGDWVVTSGLGTVIPSGLVVGTVSAVYEEPSGMSRYAVVDASADLDGLTQVFVIKEFEQVE